MYQQDRSDYVFLLGYGIVYFIIRRIVFWSAQKESRFKH